MSESVLLTPRRNFLVRALGFTAAGAAVAVPVLAVESAEARLAHHVTGAAAAFRDLFPGVPIVIRSNCLNGGHAFYAEWFSRSEPEPGRLQPVAPMACVMVCASPLSARDPERVF